MPYVDDHGLEVLKKAAHDVDVSVKYTDYYLQVGLMLAGNPATEISVSNPLPVSVVAVGGITPSTTPTITNFSVALANTEVSHALQTNLKRLLVRSRDLYKIQFAFTATESSTKFITIPAGSSYTETDLNLSGKTLYFQLSTAGIVEILEWV